MTFSAGQKRAEAEKEVNYRKRVFARLVAEGKMLQSQADYRLAIMREIADDYRKTEDTTERLPL
jgi:hypothetical protein